MWVVTDNAYTLKLVTHLHIYERGTSTIGLKHIHLHIHVSLYFDLQSGRIRPFNLQMYPVIPEPTPRNSKVAVFPVTSIDPTSSTVQQLLTTTTKSVMYAFDYFPLYMVHT